MRKLIVAEQISLDGVIQSPGGPKEDPSGDFRLGGWIVPYADDLIGQALQDLLAQPFELLLGRRTYEIFAAYWPRKGADSGSHLIADRFNSVPKHVATHRSDALAWQNSHALKGERSEEHTSELQSHSDLVCRLLLEKKNKENQYNYAPITTL